MRRVPGLGELGQAEGPEPKGPEGKKEPGGFVDPSGGLCDLGVASKSQGGERRG